MEFMPAGRADRTGQDRTRVPITVRSEAGGGQSLPGRAPQAALAAMRPAWRAFWRPTPFNTPRAPLSTSGIYAGAGGQDRTGQDADTDHSALRSAGGNQ